MIKYEDYEKYMIGQVENGSIYLWGGQGETLPMLSDAYINSRESSKSNAKRVMALRDKRKEKYPELRAYDCSGLGVALLMREGEIARDRTAHGLYTECKKITRAELKPGDFVFRQYTSGSKKGHVYHIGYVVSENKVVHAKGRDVGVVLETLNENGKTYWNAYGKSPYIANKDEGYATHIFTQTLYLKKCKGKVWEDVKALQWFLNRNGFNCGSIDGYFGKNTEKAVKVCQKANKLKVDGIAGKNTVRSLGGIWL